MKHTSYIKVKDLIIGAFIVQINMRINQVFYLFMALLLTYSDYSNNQALATIFLDHPMAVYLSLFLTFMTYILLLTFFIFFISGLLAIISITKKGVLGEHTFELNDKGMTESTQYNNSFCTYDMIVRVIVIFNNVYIQVANNWHFLPGRDFESKEKKMNFVNFIKTKKHEYQ